MTLKIDAKFEEKLICCIKNDKNLVSFDLSTQNSQKFYFDWLLLCKVYNVWPKKSPEELFFMTLMNDAKFEEKMTVGLKNNLRNMAYLHQSNWKFSKIGIFMESFYPK